MCRGNSPALQATSDLTATRHSDKIDRFCLANCLRQASILQPLDQHHEPLTP